MIAKENNRVRQINNFRELNKVIKRRPFTLPRIQDIMNRRGRYTYFTKINLSMMFYCFELDEESKKLCVINTPYGLYRFNRLPMGLKISPNIAQQIMTNLLRDILVRCPVRGKLMHAFNNEINVYIDNCGIWTNGSFEHHLKLLEQVLSKLHGAGLKCNPMKCDWAVQETNFLGHHMTPDCVKPMKKKINAVLQMQRPTNQTEARLFIGAVNFYKSLWPRRAHLLAPLTALTGNKKFVWTDKMEDAFKRMKSLMASDCINAYANLNKPFQIYTDASNYQLGAAVIQDNKPIAYFSRKLTSAQESYSTTEKELLAIVLCLKEYRKMLYGGKLHVFTDHKNLTFKTLSVQRILRWRLFMDEFDLTLHYIEGENNVIADCFSRLPQINKSAEGDSLQDRRREKIGRTIDF